MMELGVTLNALALLRESRKAREPDPVLAAFLAEQAGADAINVHLRADRRHIQERDVTLLRETVKGELNLVAAPSQELTRIALTVKPDRVTFVPERIEDAGGPLGVDVILNSSQLRQLVRMLREGSILCSVIIEPDLDQIREAHRIDANGIELSTETYVGARGEAVAQQLQRVSDAARLADKFGLFVAAGNGLSVRSIPPLLGTQGLKRLNVGYQLVARSTVVGFEKAVREMVELTKQPPPPAR
jgi:pyridoxine 5-phosphate synthase